MVRDDQDDRGPVADAATNMDVAGSSSAVSSPPLTVTRLAALLGLNRRTIAKLRLRGAPAGTDEPTWRTWCHAHGIRTRSPLVGDLGIDVPRTTDEMDPCRTTAGAEAGAPAADGSPVPPPDGFSVTNWTQRKAQRGAELLSLQARKAEIELAEKQRVLIHRDDVTRLVDAVALAVLGELVDLPVRSVQSLERLPQEWRRPVRRAIELAIDSLRRRLAAGLRQKVGKALNVPEGIPHAG